MSESDLTSAILHETEIDEAGPDVEFSDNPVCFGDGKICAECGKVFSHPFYFSTHISIHYSEKRFSVGQCNLCGLTFADPYIYQKHLISSNARMSEQAPDEGDVKKEEEFSSEYHSQDNQNFDENGDSMNLDEVVVKQEIDPDMADNLMPVNQELGRNQDPNFEPSAKRRRKMTQRYEPELISSQSMVNPDTDPAVEAYLMSLTEMGLTVDPAAFANPRARGRGRKFMGPSRGRWRGSKFPPGRDFMIADAFPSVPKKPSPKYEYLDYDVLLEDDVEVLPKSGKQTRGQRLQQRQERLSQQKEPAKAPDGAEAVKNEPGVKEESSINEHGVSDSTAAAGAATIDSPAVNKAIKRSLPSTSAGPSLSDRSFALDKQMIKAELTDKDYSPRSSSHSKAKGRGSSQKRGASPAVQLAQVRASAPGAPRPGFTGYAMASPTYRPAVSLGSDVVRPAVNKVSRAGMAANQIRMKTVTATSSASSGPKVAKIPSGIEKYKQESREYVEIMLQSLTDELIPTKMGKSSLSSKTYFGKSGDLSLGSSSSYSGNQSFFSGVGGGLMGSQRQNFGRGGLPKETYIYGNQLGQWSQPGSPWPMNNNGGSFGLLNSRPPRARGARGVGTRGGAIQSQRGAAGQRGRGGRGHGMMGVMPSTLMGPAAGLAQKPLQGLPVQTKSPLNPPTVYPVKMGRGGIGIARGGVSTSRGAHTPPPKITPPPPVKVQLPAVGTEEVIVLDDDDDDDSAARGKGPARKNQTTSDSSGAGPSGVSPLKKTAVIVDIDKEGNNIAVIENSDKKQETALKDSDKGTDKKLQQSPSVCLTRIDDVKPSVSADKTALPKDDRAETSSRGSPSDIEDNDNNRTSKNDVMLEVDDIDGWKVCLAKDSESESDVESDQDGRSTIKEAGHRNKETSPKNPEEGGPAERPDADLSIERLPEDENPSKQTKSHQSSPGDSPEHDDNPKHKSESCSRSDNSVLASHDTEDSLSSSVPSASSVPLTFPNFIGDTDNLLDIFSEIEKTCKEIEENSGNERDDSGAESDTKDLKHSESSNKAASNQHQGENSADREVQKFEEGKINEDCAEQKKKRQSNARGSLSKHGDQRRSREVTVSREEANDSKKLKDDLKNILKVIEGREVADDGDDEEANGSDDGMDDDEKNSENDSREQDRRIEDDDKEIEVEKQATVAGCDDECDDSVQQDDSSEQMTGREHDRHKDGGIIGEHQDISDIMKIDDLKTKQLDISEFDTITLKSDKEKLEIDGAHRNPDYICELNNKFDDPVSFSDESHHMTLLGHTGETKEVQSSVVMPCGAGDGGKGTFHEDVCQAELTLTQHGAKNCSNEDIEMENENEKGGVTSTVVDETDNKGDLASEMGIPIIGREKVENGSSCEEFSRCTNDAGGKTDSVNDGLEEASDTRPSNEERFGGIKDEEREGHEEQETRGESEARSGIKRTTEQCCSNTIDCVESDSEARKENNGSDEVTGGLEMPLAEPNRIDGQENKNDSDNDSKKKSPGRSSCKDKTVEEFSDHDGDEDKDGGKRNSGSGQSSDSRPHCPPHNVSGANCSSTSSNCCGDTSGSHSLSLSPTDSSIYVTISERPASFSGIHSTDFPSYLLPECCCALWAGHTNHPLPLHSLVPSEDRNLTMSRMPSNFPTCASAYRSSENCNKFHHRYKRSLSSTKALGLGTWGRNFSERVLPPQKCCTKKNIQTFNNELLPDIYRFNEMHCCCDIASSHGVMPDIFSCFQNDDIKFPSSETACQGNSYHFSKKRSQYTEHQKSPIACCWCSSKPSSFLKHRVTYRCRKGLVAATVCSKHPRNDKIVENYFRTRLHSSLRSRLAKLLGSQLREISKREMASRPDGECEMTGLTKSWPDRCRKDLLVDFLENGSIQPKWQKIPRAKSWAKSLHAASTKSLSKYTVPLNSQSKDKVKVNQCLLDLTGKVQDCRKLLFKSIPTDNLGSNSKPMSGCVHFKASFKEASSMNQLLGTDSKDWPVRTCGQKDGKSDGRQSGGPANNTGTGKSGARNNMRNFNSEDDDTESDCDDSDNDNMDGDDTEIADDGVYQLVDCPICGIIFKHVKFVKRHISLKHKKWSLSNKSIGSARPLSYVQVENIGRPCAGRAPTFMKLTESRQVSSNVYETVVLSSGTEKKEVVMVKPTKPVLRVDSGLEKKSKLDKCKSFKLSQTKITSRYKAGKPQQFDTSRQNQNLTEKISFESDQKLVDHREEPHLIGDKSEQDPETAGDVCTDPQRDKDDELYHCQEKPCTNFKQNDEAVSKHVATDDSIQPSSGNDPTSALMQVKMEACEGQPDGYSSNASPENNVQVKPEPASDSEEESLTVTFDEISVSNLLAEDISPIASHRSKISRGTQQSIQAKSNDSHCSKDPLATTLISGFEESARDCTANRDLDGNETKIKLHSVVSLATGESLLKDMRLCPPPHMNKLVIRNVGQSTPEKQEVIFVYPKKPVINFSSRCPVSPSTSHRTGQNTDPLVKSGRECRTKDRLPTNPVSHILSRKRKHEIEPQTDNLKPVVSTSTSSDMKRLSKAMTEEITQTVFTQNSRGNTAQKPSSVAGSSADAGPSERSTSRGQDNAASSYFPSQEWCVTGPTVIYVHPQKPIINFSGRAPRPCPSRSRNSSKLKNDA